MPAAENVKLVTEEFMVPAVDPGIQLYVRNKRPEGMTQFTKDSVRQYRAYLALIYVDVIEFEGTHIQKLYQSMAERFARYFEEQGSTDEIATRLRPGVSPVSALLLTCRIFFNYFSLEILFGVHEPFGKDSADVVEEVADIVRNGICAR